MFDRFWKDWDKMFSEINRDFENMMKRSIREFSENKDPDKTRTWGFKMYWDSSMDKPTIKYFGNVDPFTGKMLEEGLRVPPIEKNYNKENNQWSIIVELPGVKKDEAQLTATPNYINVETTSSKRKYRHKIDFDQEIDPETIKAKFNNGILEIKVNSKFKPKTEEKRISIE